MTPKMSKMRKVQAQRKFAQGAYIPPHASHTNNNNNNNTLERRGDHYKPAAPPAVMQNMSAFELLDIVSFQSVHLHRKETTPTPVVRLERLPPPAPKRLKRLQRPVLPQPRARLPSSIDDSIPFLTRNRSKDISLQRTMKRPPRVRPRSSIASSMPLAYLARNKPKENRNLRPTPKMVANLQNAPAASTSRPGSPYAMSIMSVPLAFRANALPAQINRARKTGVRASRVKALNKMKKFVKRLRESSRIRGQRKLTRASKEDTDTEDDTPLTLLAKSKKMDSTARPVPAARQTRTRSKSPAREQPPAKVAKTQQRPDGQEAFYTGDNIERWVKQAVKLNAAKSSPTFKVPLPPKDTKRRKHESISSKPAHGPVVKPMPAPLVALELLPVPLVTPKPVNSPEPTRPPSPTPSAALSTFIPLTEAPTPWRTKAGSVDLDKNDSKSVSTCPSVRYLTVRDVISASASEREMRCMKCSYCFRVKKVEMLSKVVQASANGRGDVYEFDEERDGGDGNASGSVLLKQFRERRGAGNRDIYLDLMPRSGHILILTNTDVNSKKVMQVKLIKRSEARTMTQENLVSNESLFDQLIETMDSLPLLEQIDVGPPTPPTSESEKNDDDKEKVAEPSNKKQERSSRKPKKRNSGELKQPKDQSKRASTSKKGKALKLQSVPTSQTDKTPVSKKMKARARSSPKTKAVTPSTRKKGATAARPPAASSSVAEPSQAPVAGPSQGADAIPSSESVAGPSRAPVESLTQKPVAGPSRTPVATPVQAPVPSPAQAPDASPPQAPVASPSRAPVAGPSRTGTSRTPTTGTSRAPATGASRAPATGSSRTPATGTSRAPGAGVTRAAAAMAPAPSAAAAPDFEDPAKKPIKPPSILKDAPVYYPTESEFNDPIAYFEKIMPLASKFGICKVVAPSSFKPSCTFGDKVRFNVANQYIARLYSRWGQATRELCAIKVYLASQSVTFDRAPLLDSVELDLPRLYRTVQRLGGLKTVIEKKRWGRVAEEMRFVKGAKLKKKLDEFYVRYLLPYDTLSTQERESIKAAVAKAWHKKNSKIADRAMNPLHRQKQLLGESPCSSDTDEDCDDISNALQEAEDCIVTGRRMSLIDFAKVAQTMMENHFRSNPTPTPQQVEEAYWRLVLLAEEHVCVNTAYIDTGDEGHGFPKNKADPYGRHPWNLKMISQNPGNVLHMLGSVLGVTVPTLHLGMLFSTSCWHRDPHGLPWMEYMHSGPAKIWYGIPDDQSAVFREAVEMLCPTAVQNKSIWLPSDITMIPPNFLLSAHVSLTRVEQKPGEYIIVFPKAYSSSISTGFTQSESVYFATKSWLKTVDQVFQELRDSCEPSMFSLEQLLISVARDPRAPPSLLQLVHSTLAGVMDDEKQHRRELRRLGVPPAPARDRPEPSRMPAGAWNVREQDECEVCRATLYLSKVTGLPEKNSAVCLSHALLLLTSKKVPPPAVSELALVVNFTVEQLDEVMAKLQHGFVHQY